MSRPRIRLRRESSSSRSDPASAAARVADHSSAVDDHHLRDIQNFISGTAQVTVHGILGGIAQGIGEIQGIHHHRQKLLAALVVLGGSKTMPTAWKPRGPSSLFSLFSVAATRMQCCDLTKRNSITTTLPLITGKLHGLA